MAKMFYTLEEAAQTLGVSADQIKQMAEQGKLQQFRDRDKLMFKREQVDQLHGMQQTMKVSTSRLSDTDDEIKTAVRLLALRARVIVEPTGAVGAAAVLSGKIGLAPGSSVGVVLSGGNIDPEMLVSLLVATAPPADEIGDQVDSHAVGQ